MIVNNQKILFLILFIAVLFMSFLAKKIIYKISKYIPKKYIDIFSIIIMKIAEKYISQNGILKMEFCTAIILYIYKKLNKLNANILIPTEKEIANNLQDIFNNYSEEINQIKNKLNCISGRVVKKEIEEIIN